MTISRFLDPKNDYVFWKVFGTEKNKDVLIGFLNHVLGYQDKNEITEVEFINPKQRPEILAYRESIIDVLCKDQNGVQIVVEMQISRHAGFEKRAQLYAAKAYSRQIIKEDENHKKMAVYSKLKAVIFLAIADFVMFPEKEAWKSQHYLLDNKTYEHDLKDFHFVFMELPKFKKKLDDLSDIQEKWAYFFKHAEKSTLEEIDRLTGNDIVIKKAFHALDQAAWNEEDLIAYEQREKHIIDNAMIAETKLFEATQKSEAKGRQEGEEEAKTAMAKEMLLEGETVEKIAKYTKLSEEQIKQLK